MYGLSQFFFSARANLGRVLASLVCASLALLLSTAFVSPTAADEDKCDILKNAHVSLKEVVENVLDKYEGLPVKAELEEAGATVSIK